MTLFNQYNQLLMSSNQDDALCASVNNKNYLFAEESAVSTASIVCYTASGPAFYYQAIEKLTRQARTAGRSAGGDGITVPKSCSFEQASTRPLENRERSLFGNGRDIASWFTEKLKIDASEVLTELLIKEDGVTTMTGVLVESPAGSRDKTVYLVGDTHIEMKEALVILLDLCIDCLDCQHLAFAVERSKSAELLNDLKWVGFELVSPNVLVKDKSVLEEYVFVGMDL